MKRRNLLKFLPLSLLPLSAGRAAVSEPNKAGLAASARIPDSGSSRDPEKNLWLVGEVYDYSQMRKWGFVGIFNNIEEANEACLTGNHFIAAAVLNDNFNDVERGWPGGCLFPNRGPASKSLDDLKNRHELVYNRISNPRSLDTRLFK